MARGGFRGTPSMNQTAQMKQMQKLQKDAMRLQEEMDTKTFTATSGGGMVTAVANGKRQLVQLTINPEVVSEEEVEMLQDLVMAAVNEAMRTAEAEVTKSMAGITAGLNLSGLF